jgi:hypothetical protein
VKIAFITSSLEPGRDGVGDYTRRLAAECNRQGHPSIVMSLNDPQVSQPAFGMQESEGTSVSVLRLPAVLPWDVRVAKARDWMNSFGPDWTSLQFVPFGFHPQGFCFGLGKRLAEISLKRKWHVMFHELWLGLGIGASAKYQVWGIMQRMTVRNMLRHLKPVVHHTQTEPFQKVLAREGIQASILPLFSNIPCANGDAWKDILEPLTTQAMGKLHDRDALYLAGVFGAVHPEWNAETAVDALLPLVHRFQKRLALVFLGKNNLPSAALADLKLRLQNRAVVIAAGEQTSVEISRLLQTLDLGLATTPLQLIQKSSTVAAMLEHGLHVLVTRDDWHLDRTDAALEEPVPQLLTLEQMALLNALPVRQGESPAKIRIGSVVAKMLGDLKPGSLTEGTRNETTSGCCI